MDFFEVVRRRRSIRRFTSAPVKPEDITTMLEAARLAPSPENEQPWRFIVVRNRELLTQMKEIVNAMVEQRLAAAAGDQKRQATIEYLRFFSTHFGDAPVVIFVLSRPFLGARGQAERLPYDPGLQSVAAATLLLVLSATSLGYGSCWTSGPVDFAHEELEAMLGVEPPWFLTGVVSLGVKDYDPAPRPIKPLEEIVSFID